MSNIPLRSMLATRLQAVEARMEAACRRAGRQRSQVTLVAVTKTASMEAAGLMHELGVRDLGESRPQELWRKAQLLPKDIRWHLIGHLQRNKIERTLPLVCLIHSVDSVRLLQAVEQDAARTGRPVDALLEINVSGEAAKHGFAPSDLGKVLPRLGELRHVRIGGLMTMAALEEDPQRCRPTFAALRGLRDEMRGQFAPPHCLTELSMGMSNDFEVAIEEGATLVRIGSALFGDPTV